jgi:hypothetical protein
MPVRFSPPRVRVLAARTHAGALSRRRNAAAALISSVLLLASSCDESTAPRHCTPGAVGTVQGYLLGGGLPAVSRVELLPAEPGQEQDKFVTQTDPTGWYSLTVPTGRYLMRFELDYYYSATRLVPERGLADTLIVAWPAQRIDIAGGAARLWLTVPPLLRERWITARMGNSNSTSRPSAWRGCMSDTGLVREFHFPFLPVGDYSMCVDFDSGPVLWLPPSLDRAEAGTLHLGTDATEDLTLTLAEPAWIRGEITGSWQVFPDMNPSILVFAPDSTLLHEERLYRTSEYRLILPVPWPVKLAVEISGRMQWVGGNDFSSATLLVPGPGEELTGVNLAESGIACILEGPGSTTRYDMDCQLYYPGGERVPGSSGYVDNPVFFSNLRPGIYFLYFRRTAWGQRWCSQWYDGAESLGAATPITITMAGEVVEVTARLREGGRISGRVTRAGGPAPGLWVSIRRTDGTQSGDAVTQTSAVDGTFELLGLNDGDYRVGVWDSHRTATNWYPGTYVSSQAAVIHVENLSAVAGIEWEIPF